MRITLGALIAAAALGGALWLHDEYRVRTWRVVCPQSGGRYTDLLCTPGVRHRGHRWADPAAVFIAIAGLGVGAAVVVGKRRASSVRA
jgi:hypothetical protein